MSRPPALPRFVRGDVDGFFGPALDDLVQLLLIATLCRTLPGMPPALLYGLVSSSRWTPGDTALALRPAWEWAAGYASMAGWLLAARWLTRESEAGR